MSGIVAAIWHLVLRSNLFSGNLYFHAIGPSLSGLTIAYYTPTLKKWKYAGLHLSVRPSVRRPFRPSVRPILVKIFRQRFLNNHAS